MPDLLRSVPNGMKVSHSLLQGCIYIRMNIYRTEQVLFLFMSKADSCKNDAAIGPIMAILQLVAQQQHQHDMLHGRRPDQTVIHHSRNPGWICQHQDPRQRTCMTRHGLMQSPRPRVYSFPYALLLRRPADTSLKRSDDRHKTVTGPTRGHARRRHMRNIENIRIRSGICPSTDPVRSDVLIAPTSLCDRVFSILW